MDSRLPTSARSTVTKSRTAKSGRLQYVADLYTDKVEFRM